MQYYTKRYFHNLDKSIGRFGDNGGREGPGVWGKGPGIWTPLFWLIGLNPPFWAWTPLFGDEDFLGCFIPYLREFDPPFKE